jgi:hypothetical protein
MIEHQHWHGPAYCKVGVKAQRLAIVGYSQYRQPNDEDSNEFTHGVMRVNVLGGEHTPAFFVQIASYFDFAEYAPEPNPETKKKDVVWFALNEERLPFALAGIWTEFNGARGCMQRGRGPVRSGDRPRLRRGLRIGRAARVGRRIGERILRRSRYARQDGDGSRPLRS